MRRLLHLRLQMIIRKALNISSCLFLVAKNKESCGKRFMHTHTHAMYLRGKTYNVLILITIYYARVPWVELRQEEPQIFVYMSCSIYHSLAFGPKFFISLLSGGRKRKSETQEASEKGRNFDWHVYHAVLFTYVKISTTRFH